MWCAISRGFIMRTPPLAFPRTLHNEWLRPKKRLRKRERGGEEKIDTMRACTLTRHTTHIHRARSFNTYTHTHRVTTHTFILAYRNIAITHMTEIIIYKQIYIPIVFNTLIIYNFYICYVMSLSTSYYLTISSPCEYPSMSQTSVTPLPPILPITRPEETPSLHNLYYVFSRLS